MEFCLSFSSTSGFARAAGLRHGQRWTMAGGVPAGASRAKSLVASKPGKPVPRWSDLRSEQVPLQRADAEGEDLP